MSETRHVSLSVQTETSRLVTPACRATLMPRPPALWLARGFFSPRFARRSDTPSLRAGLRLLRQNYRQQQQRPARETYPGCAWECTGHCVGKTASVSPLRASSCLDVRSAARTVRQTEHRRRCSVAAVVWNQTCFSCFPRAGMKWQRVLAYLRSRDFLLNSIFSLLDNSGTERGWVDVDFYSFSFIYIYLINRQYYIYIWLLKITAETRIMEAISLQF